MISKSQYTDQSTGLAIALLVDDVLDWDWPVLAASLEVDGLPGLLLAEAHVGLGPMVLTLGDGTQQ